MLHRLYFRISLILSLAFLSFGPLEAQQTYRLSPGDTLRVEVLEDPTINRAVLIAPDGRVAIPLVGNIRAGGRSIEAVRETITAALAPNFARPPTVYVALLQRRIVIPEPPEPIAPPEPDPTIDVFIVGEANRPGKLVVAPGTTVLQIFAEMGGFSKFAATKRLQLRRHDKTYALDYKAIEAGTSTAGSTRLQDGDVIVVPQRKLFE